jgi:hypothetical protein
MAIGINKNDEVTSDDLDSIPVDIVEEPSSLDGTEIPEVLEEVPTEEKKVVKIRCSTCRERFIPEDPFKWWNTDDGVCLCCGEIFCSLPPTEKQLFILQSKYFNVDQNPEHLGKIYEYLLLYSKSLILKFYQSYIQKNHIELEDLSHIVSSLIIEDICAKHKKVQTSFATMLIFKIKYCLFGNFYNHRTKAMEVSINIVDEDNKEFFELKSPDNQYELFEEKENSMYLKARVLKMIFQAEDYCTPRENMMRLIALNRFLNKGESASDKLFNLYDRIGKLRFEQTLKVIKAEIHKNLNN